MANPVNVVSLTPGSLFKLVFIGTMMSMGPIGALSGVFALFGVPSVSVEGAAVTGLTGYCSLLRCSSDSAWG